MASKKEEKQNRGVVPNPGVTDPSAGKPSSEAGEPQAAPSQADSVPQVGVPESAHEVDGQPRRSAPQQQVDPMGTLRNRPGTDDDGRVPVDAPQSEKQSAVQRGENRSIDSILDGNELQVAGGKRQVKEVFSPYQDRRVFADSENGHLYVVDGNEVVQTLVPGTPGHDAYVSQKSGQEQAEAGEEGNPNDTTTNAPKSAKSDDAK